MPQAAVSMRPKSPQRTTQFKIAAELSGLPATGPPASAAFDSQASVNSAKND
jgi:hypothetical protein